MASKKVNVFYRVTDYETGDILAEEVETYSVPREAVELPLFSVRLQYAQMYRTMVDATPERDK